MKIVATMPCRNEDWILGLSARAVLKWADEIVIGLHACTDESEFIANELLKENPGRVSIVIHPDPIWEEMAHRQALLEIARYTSANHIYTSATHIALVDADEVLSANMIPEIRSHFQDVPRGAILQLPWLCLRGGIDRYHRMGVWAEQQVSTGFVDEPSLHWSASGRAGYDFHHRHPMGRYLLPWQPLAGSHRGGLMHLQFVSGRRLRAKQALYKMTEILRWPGREPDQIRAVDRRYNLAVYGSHENRDMEAVDTSLRECPRDWWEGYEDLMRHLQPHAEPWQERECLRLLEQHGPRRFAGLDLFGIGELSTTRR